MTHVIIVGGGITGLAAAWELQQRGVAYTLLESADRLGGKIVTEYVDGFIIEAGADSFQTQKPWGWQLCREIGLELVGTSEAARTVYVLHDGVLHPMPRGMRLIVPLDADALMDSSLLTEAGKRRMLAEVHIPPNPDLSGDESLTSFLERHFGTEALELFGDSLMAGIHVSDPKKLSMAAAFPAFMQYERTHGSLIRGMQAAPPTTPDPSAPKTAFVSPRKGVYELIEALRARLTGDIRTKQAVTRIDADRVVHLAAGEKLAADAVILTTPPGAASHLLGETAPQLAKISGALTTLSSGTVSLGYHRREIDHPLDGSGFVIPHGEMVRIRACTWSSSKLPGRAPEGYALLRVFIGGHGKEQDVNLPDERLVELARTELEQIMGIRAQPVISRVYRWRSANPQYEVGHLERLAQMKTLCPPWLTLTGCAYDGVGIPDCIRQGREAARRVIDPSYEPEKLP